MTPGPDPGPGPAQGGGPALPPFPLLVEVADGGCVGHVPALPGLCFRAARPDELLRQSFPLIADYARWLADEGLADLHPPTAALVQRVQAGRTDGIMVLETERKRGAAMWESGNPAALFDHDRQPLDDDAVRAHLRFARQVVARMRAAVASLTPDQRFTKPAPERRSLDETFTHIGNCAWWYASRLDDALPQPPDEPGVDPLQRAERLLGEAEAFLLAVPATSRGETLVPKRYPSNDPAEAWTHAKVCRRQAEHVWEHLPGIIRTAGMVVGF